MKKLWIGFFFGFVTLVSAQADDPEPHSDTVYGRNFMIGAQAALYPTIETGYAWYEYLPENSKIPASTGISVSVLHSFRDKYMAAPTIGIWTEALLVDFKLDIPFYTDFNAVNSLCVRPGLGGGYNDFRITAGLNIPLNNRHAPQSRNFLISAQYILNFYAKR